MVPSARALALSAIAALAACSSSPATPAPAPAPPAPIVVHLGPVVDAAGEGSVSVDVPGGSTREITIDLDGAPRIVEVGLTGAPGKLEGTSVPALWMRPRPILAPRVGLTLVGDNPARVTVWARGAPVPKARRERSLVWTDPAIVDDKAIVGLRVVMAAAADDGHGGRMFERWFRRFATTSHSERAAPAAFADEIAAQQGADPTKWNLDALPFTVTGVHNRIDLARSLGDGPYDAAKSQSCGELRVSLASLHPVFAPLHLIFLFGQAPADDDRAPDGTIHCRGAARRWGRLSALDGPAFVDAVRRVLAGALRHDRFLVAESVELTVSPWEWRQWKPVGPDQLDNPPLFQTVDAEGLNVPGPARQDFLSFVATNAAALDARSLDIPERFRAPSARVPPSAPRTVLSLDGLPADVATKYPNLRRQIEIVGCPTCHTEKAEFVQTSSTRVFSKFYEKELDARGARLDLVNAGRDVAAPPFGPLQE